MIFTINHTKGFVR